MTEDDLAKRNKRRQRNKEAAARCRKRRLDLMTTLSEVHGLQEYPRSQCCFSKSKV